jgi:hypothetical protein
MEFIINLIIEFIKNVLSSSDDEIIYDIDEIIYDDEIID